jgi:Zn-dependent protease with chaperone function
MLHDAIYVGPTVWRKLRGVETAVSWSTLAMIYVVPGALLMLVTWPFVRVLSRRAGVGSLLRRLDTRLPDATRLAEQQLVNVVAEMAVAAGVNPPSVRVIASPTVNAVAVGLTTQDATLLVTDGFLEQLDRDERQAIVAHLVGSVGNGDLEIGATIFSVFETWALMGAILETPLSSARRAFVRRFTRAVYAEMRGRGDEHEARAVIDQLVGGPDHEEFISMVEAIEPKSARDGCFIVVIKVPLIAVIGLSTIAAKESTNLFTLFALGPWLAAMWRARRRLADATAVQLTRHPEAIASAVRTMAKCDVEVPGGWPFHFLFPVWVPVSEKSAAQYSNVSTHVVGMRLDPEPRLRRLAALGASLGESGRVRLVDRIKASLGTWEEVRMVLIWAPVAVALIAVLLVVTMLSASLLLMLLWYLLGFLR